MSARPGGVRGPHPLSLASCSGLTAYPLSLPGSPAIPLFLPHPLSPLRNRGVLGLKFRRQHVLHGFIVDFYLRHQAAGPGAGGYVHAGRDRPIYDAARAEFLEAAGYRVVRMRNREVTRERLEERLRYALRKPLVVPPLPKGEGARG